MDIDRFLATHSPAWDRLGALTIRARRQARNLSAAELDEMVRLYQRASTHLSYASTNYSDPALAARLTGLVAAAAGVVYGTQPRTWKGFTRFFSATFPAAVRHMRWAMLFSALLLSVPASAVAVWLANSSEALEASAPEAVREAYVENDFEEYYASEEAAEFSSEVFTHNVLVSFMAFAAGIAFCAVTAYVLISNGLAIGGAAGLFIAVGEASKFWGLILPHGLLELTAVTMAGGAGLHVGWTLIAPGERLRRDALAEEGRRSLSVVLGVVVLLLVSGLIEGFVTGQPWPTALRVGIGVMAWSAVLIYVVAYGRGAATLEHAPLDARSTTVQPL